MSEEKPQFRHNREALADALSSLASGAEPAYLEPDASADAARMSDADDAMLAPPPDQSMLARPRETQSSALDHSIQRRRTLIPSLLTLGVLLPIVGSLKWISPAESIFSTWSSLVSIALMAVGLGLLGVGIVTMQQVKHMLRGRQRVRHSI